jgi:hypothetical protein
MTPPRKRPEKTEPTRPKEDVRQDSDHNESDFLRDLGKVTSNRARKKLGLPSPRG